MNTAVFYLGNGNIVELNGDEVRHIDANGNVLYDSALISGTKRIPYFFIMGEAEREIVYNWIKDALPETVAQKDFCERVITALDTIEYDYQIATIEPSITSYGAIYYNAGAEVAWKRSCGEWAKLAREFYSDEEWYSDLATLYEGVLFKAYRIAMGYWTIEYVCDDSSGAGNYINSPDSSRRVNMAGTHEVGGFKDGVGNTYEVYKYTENSFALAGGTCNNYGFENPLMQVSTQVSSGFQAYMGHGVVAIRRRK